MKNRPFDNYLQVYQEIEDCGFNRFIWRWDKLDMPDQRGIALFEKMKKAIQEFEAYIENEAEEVE